MSLRSAAGVVNAAGVALTITLQSMVLTSPSAIRSNTSRRNRSWHCCRLMVLETEPHVKRAVTGASSPSNPTVMKKSNPMNDSTSMVPASPAAVSASNCDRVDPQVGVDTSRKPCQLVSPLSSVPAGSPIREWVASAPTGARVSPSWPRG